MPSLAHLDSKNTLNALLNMLFGRRGVFPPPARELVSNLTRLTDKAVLEYEAARSALDRFVYPPHNRPIGDLLRTCDHLETCLDSVHRAGLHAEELRDLPGQPTVTAGQLPSREAHDRVRIVRNAVQHAEQRILDGKTGFGTGRPTALLATDTTLVAGQKGLYIRYAWLAAWITLYHDLVRKLIE